MFNRDLKRAVLLALGTGIMTPTLAHASLVTTTASASFSVTGSVNDTLPAATGSTNGATTSSNLNLGTTQVGQFNASTGVLTGVTVNLQSTQKQTTAVSSAGTTSGSNAGSANASGTGTSTVRLEVPNGVPSAGSTATAVDTCAGKPKDACNDAPTVKQVNANLAVNSANLNAYAGNGTFGVSHIATTLSAETTSNSYNSQATTTSTVDWQGTLDATYSYLLHAAQSFDPSSSALALTLDFGTVYLGDTVASKSFGISNLAGDRVGLSLTSFTETGDTSNLFSTSLATFNNLGQGNTNSFIASFLANTLGSYGASYKLTLADVAPDVAYASNTLGSGYNLTLNVLGNVIERPPQQNAGDVPEPGSLALLGIGGCAFFMRKRSSRLKRGAGTVKG
jgi:hypothetical protein